jgi:hypothetical protein
MAKDSAEGTEPDYETLLANFITARKGLTASIVGFTRDAYRDHSPEKAEAMAKATEAILEQDTKFIMALFRQIERDLARLNKSLGPRIKSKRDSAARDYADYRTKAAELVAADPLLARSMAAQAKAVRKALGLGRDKLRTIRRALAKK